MIDHEQAARIPRLRAIPLQPPSSRRSTLLLLLCALLLDGVVAVFLPEAVGRYFMDDEGL